MRKGHQLFRSQTIFHVITDNCQIKYTSKQRSSKNNDYPPTLSSCLPIQKQQLMFITSQPFHQKRNFKFSNQLAGKTFNNRRFLSSCSYLDSDLKLSTAGSEEESNKPRQQSMILDRFPSRSLVNRSKQVRSAAQNNVDRERRNTLKPSNRKYSVATDRKTQLGKKVFINSEKIETRRTNILQTTLTMVQQMINMKKPLRKKSLKRKLAFNPNIDLFYSPFIKIRIVDKIKDLKQLEEKSLSVNFEKIYKKLIKTQLMGQFTVNFMETIERYIRQIIQNDEMYDNPIEVQLQPELKTLSRKQQFLQKIIQLWGNSDTLKLRELVKFYCIPSQSASNKILSDLLSDLVIEIYQKKCCNRDKQYALLTVNGSQIKHISEIYFSTQELLLIPKEDVQKNYVFYKHLIEQHDRSLKMTIRQSIKHNFVQKIVNNQIDDKKINYHEDPHGFDETRRQMVQIATIAIQSKSKARLQTKKARMPNEQAFDQIFRRKQSRNDDLFTNYIIRRQREKKEYAQILQKLRKILDPNHIYVVQSKLDESTEQQFRKLHLYNDKYDITYNHNKENSRKLFLINMIENCKVFTSKNTEQVQKIINMIESVYGMGMDNINQIQFWQFKEIYETAHGVSNKDVIMKFVLNYLVFDQYGEMQKEQFFNLIDLCISQTGRPKRLIKENIWGLFQSMNLVENKALTKKNMSIWYEPIRVVYLLLLSVIFGTEYESLQEMARDLLKYYND